MSTEIYDDAGLIVTRYAGPADEGPDRRRWQINVVGDSTEHTVLNAAEVLELTHALALSALPSEKVSA